ncbi:MAG TPA: hypothetical protein VH917_06900, partial [Ignavibacteriaceae bacterium]
NLTKLLQKEVINIKCPHCGKQISDAWMCKLESIIGTRFVYLCIDCQKLIGVASQQISEGNLNFLRMEKAFLPPGSELS